ncbi:hypothetical protein MHEI_40610 [Mycobacterium heidelbergense]|nr:hypothetical protein MHEI_40610 [Mycobacterium heidelbergense]
MSGKEWIRKELNAIAHRLVDGYRREPTLLLRYIRRCESSERAHPNRPSQLAFDDVVDP